MGSASAGEWVAAVLNPDCHKADDEGEDACDDCRKVSEIHHIVRFREMQSEYGCTNLLLLEGR